MHYDLLGSCKQLIDDNVQQLLSTVVVCFKVAQETKSNKTENRQFFIKAFEQQTCFIALKVFCCPYKYMFTKDHILKQLSDVRGFKHFTYGIKVLPYLALKCLSIKQGEKSMPLPMRRMNLRRVCLIFLLVTSAYMIWMFCGLNNSADSFRFGDYGAVQFDDKEKDSEVM